MMRRFLLLLVFWSVFIPLNAQISYPHFINGAHLALSKEDYKEAIGELNKAIKLKPENFEPYYLRGYAKYCLEDFSGALRDLDKTLSINPLYIKAFLYHGFCNMEIKNYGEALKDFENGLKIDPFDTDLFIARAALFLQIGQYEKAIADYDFALGFKPELSPATRSNMALAYVNRGIAKAHLKHYDEALADLDKALYYDFLNAEIPFRKGMVQLERGADSAALSDFSKALDLNPKHPLYLFYHATALLQTGDTLNAMIEYENVNRLDPRNALTYFRRGVIYSIRNEFGKAIEMYDLVTTINPDNIYGYFNRSLVYCEQKRWIKAEADLSKVLQLNPLFVGAWINRAIVRQEKGDLQGSRMDHQKALAAIEARHGAGKDLEHLYRRYADSVYFDKITAFNADFVNGETRNNRLQYADGDIMPFPNIILTPASDEEHAGSDRSSRSYLDKPLSLINSSGKLPIKLVFKTEDPYLPSLLIDETFLNSIGDKELQQLLLGIVEQHNGNYSKAEDHYQQLPGNTELAGYATLNRSALLTTMESQRVASLLGQTLLFPSAGNTKDSISSDYSEIARLLTEQLTENKHQAFLWYNLGNTYLQMKAYHRAIDAFSEAIAQRSDLAEAYYNRALTLIFTGETELARYDLSHAGELGISEAYSVLKRFGKR